MRLINTDQKIFGFSNDDTSISHIDGCYYKIGNTIYCTYKDKILDGVDPRSFRVLDFLVAKDRNHVYIENREQPVYDAETFDSFSKLDLRLPYIKLFHDKNGYYFQTLNNSLEPINLDFDSAKNIDLQYISDINGIYFLNHGIKKLQNVDLKSFHILGSCMSVEMSYSEYAADRDHVFSGDGILQGIDPASFHQIAKVTSLEDSEIPYAIYLWKDSKNVYVYCGTQIKEADYDTFEFKNGRAQDKNNFYDFNTGGESYKVIPKY